MNWIKSCVGLIALLCCSVLSSAQVWQWSVPVNAVVSEETHAHPQVFLWIPENCNRVRAVVVGQHNMIEEGIFEHPAFRKNMTALGFAMVWISPNLDITFDFNHGAGEAFDAMMKQLADASGYDELASAPVVPIGHSALASYPWNFAAWNPARTLAIISVHGDAPLTNLTGSGRPNPAWGNRSIDGVPGLFIMSEYEWWEDRITPGFKYVNKHPGTPITFLADAGHGHFDYSDALVDYICLFLRKAARYRLPDVLSSHLIVLRSIDPSKGYLIDRWRKDSVPTAGAAPCKAYTGDRNVASWVFDKEQAVKTEKFYLRSRGKEKQYLGFMQQGQIVRPTGGHAEFTVPFVPLQDGISFRLSSFFADTSRMVPVVEHPHSAAKVSRICGPVVKLNDTTFQIRFYRMGFDNPKRSNDIWLLASNNGDKRFKSAVQQLDMHFPLFNREGKAQQINFAPIPDQKETTGKINLHARSTAGVPVHYYVQEGPALIEGSTLLLQKIPPRAKYPVRVTVVAWQYGTSVEPKLQSAAPVEQGFFVYKK